MTAIGQTSPVQELILAKCGPQGATVLEMVERWGENARQVAWRLEKSRRLFRAGGGRSFRYFASIEDRDRFAAEWEAAAEQRKAEEREKHREYERRYEAKRRAERAARPSRKAANTVWQKTPDALKKAPSKYAVVPAPSSVPAPVTVRHTTSSRPAYMAGEPVITPNTKVTVAPVGVDYRYAVDPSIAGRGAISADWMARRQQEAA
jgi:hypothetical protein